MINPGQDYNEEDAARKESLIDSDHTITADAPPTSRRDDGFDENV